MDTDHTYVTGAVLAQLEDLAPADRVHLLAAILADLTAISPLEMVPPATMPIYDRDPAAIVADALDAYVRIVRTNRATCTVWLALHNDDPRGPDWLEIAAEVIDHAQNVDLLHMGDSDNDDDDDIREMLMSDIRAAVKSGELTDRLGIADGYDPISAEMAPAIVEATARLGDGHADSRVTYPALDHIESLVRTTREYLDVATGNTAVTS